MASTRKRRLAEPTLGVAQLRDLTTSDSRARRVWVAFSGGVDSHVLLHLLATHRQQIKAPIAAAHVDHGLQKESTHWARHCRRVCEDLGLDLCVVRVDARPRPGESPEAAARAARYTALRGLMGTDDDLATAHHLDDQAETILLQLLRGAGPCGLAGMPEAVRWGTGRLLRPLLQVSRTEILSYARFHGLKWIEDGTNTDVGLERNSVRHEILPRLRDRRPNVARTLARSAQLCAESAQLLNAMADEDIARAKAGHPACLSVPVLRSLEETRVRNLLRRWIRRLGLPTPAATHIRHIVADVILVPRDREPCVRWPGAEVRRYRERLFVMPQLAAHDSLRVWPWDGTAAIDIPGVGRCSLRAARGEGLQAHALLGRRLTLRFRRGGERFHPFGRVHGHALKRILQEAGIPPWERERIPLLYVEDDLVAVAGLGVSTSHVAQATEDGLIFEWQKQRPFDTL